MSKPFGVEHALEIAVGVCSVGALLTVLSLVQLTVVDIGLGDWAYWLVVMGLISFLVGVYLLSGYLRLAAQFDKYLDTESRAEFKKNQDEVEYLAWRLPSRYNDRLVKKMKDLGLK